MLALSRIDRSYGGVKAIDDVTVTVDDGELVGIIGPNGAGKSTLLGLVGGAIAPQSGRIEFDGVDITRMRSDKRARLGIATVFQGSRLFRGMTVRENVMVGASCWTKSGAVAASVRTRGMKREEQEIREAATDALARVGLSDWADRSAEGLPLGQQRRVQVARALAAHPRLLLLDEPASGLRTEERADLGELIRDVESEGIAVVLIEHDVSMVMGLSRRIIVLNLGRVIANDTPAAVRRNPRVIEAYLGGQVDDADD